MDHPASAQPDDDDRRSDAQLVAAANTGDAAAFDAIYRRYHGWVARLAYRFTNDRDAALDVTQETFLYLLRKFPGLHLTARLTTLLYPAVKHLARDWRRKRERHAATGPLPEDLPAPPVPDRQADRDDLDAALAALSHDHREVLLMRYVDGMALSEIAHALALPLGTVKSRLHHALTRVRGTAKPADEKN